jgi:hypothetical protein
MRDLGVQLQYNLAATSSYDTLVRRYFLYFVNWLEVLHGSWQHNCKFFWFELAVNSEWEMAVILHDAKLLLCELKNSYSSLFMYFYTSQNFALWSRKYC